MGPETSLESVVDQPFCYVTTTGRHTGRPHEIEIWFWLAGTSIYLLAGGGSSADWVRNLIAQPDVEVRVGPLRLRGRGRVVEEPDESARARAALFEKYQPGYSGDLTSWSRDALPIAIDIQEH